jgi:ribosomal protein S18 acetylase RimI-like enzyme
MGQERLKIVTLSEDNIEAEHICCAIADSKHATGVANKKELLKNRFAEGFTFKRFDVRGKAFIEYVPAENAWAPIRAPGYTFIHCFWVSGRFKGKGLGKRLLAECLADSKDKNGIAVITASKVMPFLTDKRFFLRHDFQVCDTAPPYFELLVRKNRKAPSPTFAKSAKRGSYGQKTGLTFVYSHMCPFTPFWVDEMQAVAKRLKIPSRTVRIETKKQAQNSPSPFTIFSVFYDGEFLTHKIMSQNQFARLLAERE